MISGKNILITGATSGIGNAIAKYFHSQNANVFLVARSESKLQSMADDFGKRAWVYSIDLAELNHIKAMFEFAKENGIKFDGIVHCAGVAFNLPIKVNDIAQMEYTVRVNLESFMEMCKYVASRKYANEGASVIAMSSTVSLCGDKGLSAYSATKAAINNFVKCAAMELSSRNIRVNAIAPAMVETNMYYDTIRELPEMENIVKGNQPFGLIQPEYIAYLAEYLLSEKSRYITGTTIVMGAGHIF